MAPVVSDVSIHQTLHGYSDGHRQIASSGVLSQRDAKTVLILSDVSSSGLRIPETGYLTGYPLVESGYYAIARTWSATEQPRPGCVWTHTLLIDFTDLALLKDWFTLLSLFERPGTATAKRSASAYEMPILLRGLGEKPVPLVGRESLLLARQLMAALYELPGAAVVGTAPEGANVDHAVMALFAQQWPRLRRSFRFCTLTSSDRSTDEWQFDLQLLPQSGRSLHGMFPKALNISEMAISSGPWLEHGVADLADPSKIGLREFFQRVGSDVAQGRKAFFALTKLHLLLSQEPLRPDAIQSAINILQLSFEESAAPTFARQALVTAAAGRVRDLDSHGLTFLLENIDALSELDLVDNAAEIGRVTWRANPDLMISELSRGTSALQIVANAGLLESDAEELILQLSQHPHWLRSIVERRPLLLEDLNLWRQGGKVAAEALRFATTLGGLSPRVVTSAIRGLPDPTQFRLAPKGLAFEMLWRSLLDSTAAHTEASRAEWLAIAVENCDALATVLSTNEVNEAQALYTAASVTNPDSVPNDFGDDPWAVALRRCNWTPNVQDSRDLLLASYLLARSFGPRSRNIAELMNRTLKTVHKGIALETIPFEAWQLLDKLLPPSPWSSWDRCKRLRRAAGQLFVKRQLSALAFLELDVPNDIFHEMLDAAKDEWHGRSYLRDLQMIARGSKSKEIATRWDLVRQTLDASFW
jgi:hypothetical protein